MTLPQAQAVAAAATNAGFNAALTHVNGAWKVQVASNDLDIPVSAADSLATTQGVSAFVSLVSYV